MSEIPDDVMKAARVAVFQFETWVQTTQLPDNGNEASVKLADTVAGVLLAERERCAKKAFDEEQTYGSGQGLEWLYGYIAGRQAAASAIRSPALVSEPSQS